MYNDDKLNNPLFRLELLVEKFEHYWFVQPNQYFNKVPNVFIIVSNIQSDTSIGQPIIN